MIPFNNTEIAHHFQEQKDITVSMRNIGITQALFIVLCTETSGRTLKAFLTTAIYCTYVQYGTTEYFSCDRNNRDTFYDNTKTTHIPFLPLNRPIVFFPYVGEPHTYSYLPELCSLLHILQRTTSIHVRLWNYSAIVCLQYTALLNIAWYKNYSIFSAGEYFCHYINAKSGIMPGLEL